MAEQRCFEIRLLELTAPVEVRTVSVSSEAAPKKPCLAIRETESCFGAYEYFLRLLISDSNEPGFDRS